MPQANIKHEINPELILPLGQETASRPEWSVMIPVCNRVKFLRQTLESVLAQDPGADIMQICIIDNSTEAIDWKSWLTPREFARVNVSKQKKHLPFAANWNSAIHQARGKFIHILHDDDFIQQGFYQTIGETAARHPDCGVYFVRCFMISESGEIINLTQRYEDLESPCDRPGKLFYLNHLQAPGVVVRRSAYELAGGFCSDFVFCPDWHMWIRLIAQCNGIFINKPLASYRIHNHNLTTGLINDAVGMRDMMRLADWIERNFADFSREEFDAMLAHLTREKIESFSRSGDQKSVEAYRALLEELNSKHQTPTLHVRIINLLRKIAGAVRQF
jgi:hypothetical protein